MGVDEQLQTDEEILYRAHVTRISLIPWFVLLAVLTAASVVVWNLTGNVPGTAVLGVLVLGALGTIGVKLLVLRSNEYVLTNRRVIRQTGIFTQRSIDSHLEKVNNVEHVQTLWGRILGYGDVLVDTASETGTTLFPRISRPLDFKRAIVGAAEAYRANRGLAFAGRPAAVSAVSAAPAPPAGAERLRQLKGLLDDGLISAEEFESKRRQILSEM